MKDIYILIALKSVLELNRLSSFNLLISEISDKNLARKIISELKRRNYGNITTMIDKYLFDNFQNLVTNQLNDIKQFDFDEMSDCKINEIKDALGLTQLDFNTLKNIDGEDTDFYRYWDNLNRFAVFCKKELVDAIKQNPEYSLYLEKEIKEGKLGKYTKFTICSQKDIERFYDDRVTDRSHMGEYNDWHSDAYENDDSNLWNTD